MPQNPARKARTRAEILAHAARLFRLRGTPEPISTTSCWRPGLTARGVLCSFHLEGRFVRGSNPGWPRTAEPAAGRRAAGGAESVSRQSESHGHRPRLHLGRPARRHRPRSAGRRLAYANILYATIAELARGRSRKLDADATVVAILAVGAVTLARASGDTRAQRLAACGARSEPPQPFSSRELRQRRKRSRSRRKAAGARPAKPAARSRGGRA